MQGEAERVARVLAAVRGQPCWGAIPPTEEDYAFVLEIGAKEPRALRLANPNLSFEQRTFEGTHGLLVQAPWRLEGPDGVVATCFDDAGIEGPVRPAIYELEGRAITHIFAEPPGYDLVVRFDDAWTLRVFALEVREDNDGNWTVWAPEGVVIVGIRSRLTVREPDDPVPSGHLRAVDPTDDEAEVRLWQARWRARRGEAPEGDEG